MEVLNYLQTEARTRIVQLGKREGPFLARHSNSLALLPRSTALLPRGTALLPQGTEHTGAGTPGGKCIGATSDLWLSSPSLPPPLSLVLVRDAGRVAAMETTPEVGRCGETLTSMAQVQLRSFPWDRAPGRGL